MSDHERPDPNPLDNSRSSEPSNKWAWERALRERAPAVKMPPTAQHVALLLSTYADGQGTGIRPTVATLCAVSGRTKDTVHKALKWLRDNGWVEQVSKGSGTTGQASVYRLTVPRV